MEVMGVVEMTVPTVNMDLMMEMVVVTTEVVVMGMMEEEIVMITMMKMKMTDKMMMKEVGMREMLITTSMIITNFLRSCVNFSLTTSTLVKMGLGQGSFSKDKLLLTSESHGFLQTAQYSTL